MAWRKTVVKQAVTTRLPFHRSLRKIKRNLFGYPPDPYHLKYTISQYFVLRNVIEKFGVSIKGATVLEIGSGWFPTLPILFARDGASRVIMSDVEKHMDEVTFGEALSALKERFPDDAFIQDLNKLSDLPIDYNAPFQIDDVPDGSLDVVTSRTVLEHIPKTDLYELLARLSPKLKPGGLMTHLVDHSDHLEQTDKSISKINFLTWSEEKHALVNFLKQDGENRMRHHEYYSLISDAGYDLLDEMVYVHEGTLQAAKELPLVYPYSKMTPEQLATLVSVYSFKRRDPGVQPRPVNEISPRPIEGDLWNWSPSGEAD